jgi:hypothetical protein
VKKKIVEKSKKVKTGSNLAESCKEGYGLKGAVLPMVMMMIMRRRKKTEKPDSIVVRSRIMEV